MQILDNTENRILYSVVIMNTVYADLNVWWSIENVHPYTDPRTYREPHNTASSGHGVSKISALKQVLGEYV